MENKNQTEKGILDLFFRPPLYISNIENKYVTLYTSVYKPIDKTASIMWPGKTVTQSFDNFIEQKVLIDNLIELPLAHLKK